MSKYSDARLTLSSDVSGTQKVGANVEMLSFTFGRSRNYAENVNSATFGAETDIQTDFRSIPMVEP